MNESQEPKYGINDNGEIYNRETGSVIPEDEPIFILRARDIHAIDALKNYSDLCEVDGHIMTVLHRIQDFAKFAKNNPERMREPGGKR